VTRVVFPDGKALFFLHGRRKYSTKPMADGGFFLSFCNHRCTIDFSPFGPTLRLRTIHQQQKKAGNGFAEVVMNKQKCESEKFSSRTVGLALLPLAFGLGFLGALILPVVGFFFSVPIFILAFTFLAAPESKVCRLILRKDES
jgi:hypothetical protein